MKLNVSKPSKARLFVKGQGIELKFAVKTAPVVVVGGIVKQYGVCLVHAIITEANDRHFYIVKEPELTENEVALYSELIWFLFIK